MIHGYIRVSTPEQNPSRQESLLLSKGAERLWMDKSSGKNLHRENLNNMLASLNKGDSIIVESISRLSRKAVDILHLFSIVESRGCSLISVKEPIDTSSHQGKFMLTVFAAMAENERETILQRQAEGIAIAKAEGKYKGRQPVKVDADAFKAQYQEWKAGKQTARATMANLGLKQRTFYRLVEEYEGRAERVIHKGII